MTEQRLSLEAAGKLLGITANAMRARAKKAPEKHRLEADNSGKLWVWIDPLAVPSKPLNLKPSKDRIEGSNESELKASIEALRREVSKSLEVAVLEERIRGLEAYLAELKAANANLEAVNADLRAAQAVPRKPWWKRLVS